MNTRARKAAAWFLEGVGKWVLSLLLLGLFCIIFGATPEQFLLSHLNYMPPWFSSWPVRSVLIVFGIGCLVGGIMRSRDHLNSKDIQRAANTRKKPLLTVATGGRISARHAEVPADLPFPLAKAESGGTIMMDNIKITPLANGDGYQVHVSGGGSSKQNR